MEIDCNGIKRKPSPLDLNRLLDTDSSDDDHPPELVVKSEHEITENPMEDVELMKKTDHEITKSNARVRKTFQSFGDKLPDKGQKTDIGCEETIQLSDHSDDGASHGKKKSPSMFANMFYKKMEEDKDSKIENAFEKDSPYMNPCQSRRLTKSQILAMKRSKMGISSSLSPNNPLADSKKHIIFDDDDNKDGDFTTSFSEPNSPQDPPSRNLRPRRNRAYHLVGMEPLKLKFMANLDPCMKDVRVYYPSRDDTNAVEVSYDDMACLAPEACLSSTIMNFYIQFLQQPSSSSENATCSYHFFNTYFYNKLQKLSYEEDSFRKFRKWWKGVRIFEKAYILLPIHENAHWSLVIICLPNKDDELGPILLHLDSLGLHDSNLLFYNIKRFLTEEWSYLRKSESSVNLSVPTEIWENLDCRVDHRCVTVPQQKNDYDCGLFVLFYMERFIKEAPERFKKKDLSMFSRNWFRAREASNLRTKIFNLLVEQFKKAKEC